MGHPYKSSWTQHKSPLNVTDEEEGDEDKEDEEDEVLVGDQALDFLSTDFGMEDGEEDDDDEGTIKRLTCRPGMLHHTSHCTSWCTSLSFLSFSLSLFLFFFLSTGMSSKAMKHMALQHSEEVTRTA